MKRKGITIGSVIGIVFAIAAVVFAVGLLGKFFGLFGDKGDGEGSGDQQVSSAQSELATTAPVITTENIQFIEIVVKGNEYWFANNQYTLDDIGGLVSVVKKESQDKGVQVRVRDNGASVKAFRTLLSELKANGVNYADENEKKE